MIRNTTWLFVGLIVVLFAALLVLASGQPAWAAPNQAGTVPPPPTPTPTPGPGQPPRSSGTAFNPPTGGVGTQTNESLTAGTGSFYMPGSAVPPGQTYTATVWVPLLNGLPTGDGGRAFRGPGNNLLAVQITDANGNTVHSLNPPGATICFTYPANILFDYYGEAIQYYTGNSSSPWSTLPGPYTRTVLADGSIRLCTNVTSF